MAQIIIEVEDEDLKNFKDGYLSHKRVDKFLDAIREGIVLDKTHGAIVDADKFMKVLDKIWSIPHRGISYADIENAVKLETP